MSIIPQIYLDAVVSIGVRNTNGDINWIGTGFFVIRTVDENKGIPFLVSNRHVFDGNEKIVIRMKEKNSDALKTLDIIIVGNSGRPKYSTHSNPNIDIAVLKLNPNDIVNNNLEFPAFDIDTNAMSSSQLRTSGADAGSLIYMLGFPLGLVNHESGLPICRLGCMARISETQIKEEHNILIDIQNFPGNSGSPIILRPEIISVGGTQALSECVLVGIVHSYIPYQEKLVNLQTHKVVEVRSENSGIANVHPVEYILDVIDAIYPKSDVNKNENDEVQDHGYK